MLVDALREDMIEGDFLNYDFNYQNYKMKIFNNLIQAHPNNTQIYSLRADTPTLTSQWIKGFTTGTIPTFFDMGENIGDSSEVVEDSILH